MLSESLDPRSISNLSGFLTAALLAHCSLTFKWGYICSWHGIFIFEIYNNSRFACGYIQLSHWLLTMSAGPVGAFLATILSIMCWQWRHNMDDRHKKMGPDDHSLPSASSEIDDEQQDQLEQLLNSKIHKFVLTGGPCSGKTTAMEKLQGFLRERGTTTRDWQLIAETKLWRYITSLLRKRLLNMWMMKGSWS